MKTIKRVFTNLKRATGLGFVAQFFIGTAVFGMCCGFFPPERAILPADNTKTLVVFQDGVQHMIVQPEFQGSLEDFGLVMPAPNLPDVSEAPKDLFTKLEDFTNPKREFDNFVLESVGSLDTNAERSSGVTVIDRKDVGQYTATILKATDASELNEWLADNGYESDAKRDEIMSYYVRESGYFVALKVNMSAVRAQRLEEVKFAQSQDFVDINFGAGGPIGNSFLDPIDISYKADEQRIPTRLLAASPFTLSYTIYSLSAEPYIIPGGNVEFSKPLGIVESLTDEAKVLLPYNPAGQWLVRNKVWIDPEQADEDIVMTRIADAGSSVVDAETTRRNVNPNLWTKESGVVRQDCFARGVFDEEQGRWITPEFSMEQCSSDYTFDLGIGDADTSRGLPLLNIARIVIVAVLGLFVWDRYRAYKKHGSKGLIPRPDKAFITAIDWIDHKTDHKLIGNKKNRTIYWLAVRNSVVFFIGMSVSYQLGVWAEDQGFTVSADEFSEFFWVFAPAFLSGGLLFFITPTRLALYRSKGQMLGYLAIVCIILLIFTPVLSQLFN